VTAVACAQLDGRPIAVTSGQDRTVRIWDLTTGIPISGPLVGHTDSVTAVACTQLDGRPIAVTSGRDHMVQVWDLAGSGLIKCSQINYFSRFGRVVSWPGEAVSV
jgi:WD40 repeat protein